MDYDRQIYIAKCQAFLLNPDNIEPNELSKYFASNSYLGMNDYITSLVQRYFYINLSHPELLKYIHLLDRLIKYSFPLPQSFVHMFTQCFCQAVQNGRKTIQEELKILRKLWTPVLNENIIHEMRLEIFNRMRVDIEQELREESKKFLRQYLEKNMLLPASVITQILSVKSFLSKPILQQFIPVSYPIPIPPTPAQFFGKPGKKTKLSEDTQAQIKPLSKLQQSLLILNKLRNLNSYCCKQCGKFFQTQTALQQHKNGHFQQKMKKYIEKKSNQNLKKMNVHKKGIKIQMSVEEWNWSNDIQNNFVNSHVIISPNQQFSFNSVCTFCGCMLDTTIIDDSFVYKNAIKVYKQEKSIEYSENEFHLIHTGCYKVLTSTQLQ